MMDWAYRYPYHRRRERGVYRVDPSTRLLCPPALGLVGVFFLFSLSVSLTVMNTKTVFGQKKKKKKRKRKRKKKDTIVIFLVFVVAILFDLLL